ncbi:MAG: nucleotidyl transferase AbiEii/AbiGii toxin family protein [Thermoleophilia bacterium]|nr:nucleotidyl transferase AbiEii/AbiGii toxin family protein [Thermoleophilia bacterium]
MISRAEIQDRAREWGLTDEVVEKDYVLGWLLWGIGQDPRLSDHWVFKGGTCLKKCYLETYRFSEDLDFTVQEGGPLTPRGAHPPPVRGARHNRAGERHRADHAATRCAAPAGRSLG